MVGNVGNTLFLVILQHEQLSRASTGDGTASVTPQIFNNVCSASEVLPMVAHAVQGSHVANIDQVVTRIALSRKLSVAFGQYLSGLWMALVLTIRILVYQLLYSFGLGHQFTSKINDTYQKLTTSEQPTLKQTPLQAISGLLETLSQNIRVMYAKER